MLFTKGLTIASVHPEQARKKWMNIQVLMLGQKYQSTS